MLEGTKYVPFMDTLKSILTKQKWMILMDKLFITNHPTFKAGSIVEAVKSPKWCWSYEKHGWHTRDTQGYTCVVLPKDCIVIDKNFEKAMDEISEYWREHVIKPMNEQSSARDTKNERYLGDL